MFNVPPWAVVAASIGSRARVRGLSSSRRRTLSVHLSFTMQRYTFFLSLANKMPKKARKKTRTPKNDLNGYRIQNTVFSARGEKWRNKKYYYI